MCFLTYFRSKHWAHHASSKMNGIPGLILKELTVLQGEITEREGYGMNQKALERASGM